MRHAQILAYVMLSHEWETLQRDVQLDVPAYSERIEGLAFALDRSWNDLSNDEQSAANEIFTGVSS